MLVTAKVLRSWRIKRRVSGAAASTAGSSLADRKDWMDATGRGASSQSCPQPLPCHCSAPTSPSPTMASRLLRSSAVLPQSSLARPAHHWTSRLPARLPRMTAIRPISNVASTSVYAAPAALRMEPPTQQQEAEDFTKACDEVQRWFDSPRFKGIKVRGQWPRFACSRLTVCFPHSDLMGQQTSSPSGVQSRCSLRNRRSWQTSSSRSSPTASRSASQCIQWAPLTPSSSHRWPTFLK